MAGGIRPFFLTKPNQLAKGPVIGYVAGLSSANTPSRSSNTRGSCMVRFYILLRRGKDAVKRSDFLPGRDAVKRSFA